MKGLILAFLQGNQTCIECNRKTSSLISVCRGVPQGGPLSPVLFNLAVNFIYDDICDQENAERHGYSFDPNYKSVILTGFADDKALTTKSVEAAVDTVNLVGTLLNKIGLSINTSKSSAIVLKKGQLFNENLELLQVKSSRPSPKMKRSNILDVLFRKN